jgi:hypothetical protein
MLKRNLSVLVLTTALVGGGTVAWAQTSDTSPSAPAPSTSAAEAPNGQQAGPRSRHHRPGALLGRVVHGDLVVRGQDGKFENVTYDRGTLDGVDGDTLTITRPDGKKVSVNLTSDTKYRGVANAGELKTGKQTIVTSRDGKALTVAQRPGDGQRGPGQRGPGQQR